MLLFTILFKGFAVSRGQVHDDTLVVLIMMGYLVVVFVGPWLYEALMESSRYEGTLGKRAVGIRVVGLDGRQISFGRATGRHFGKILSAFTLEIGFLMAGFTKQKQALHDMVAGTLVIHR